MTELLLSSRRWIYIVMLVAGLAWGIYFIYTASGVGEPPGHGR